MTAYKKGMKRRDFLEWLAVAGIGGVAALNGCFPLSLAEQPAKAAAVVSGPQPATQATPISFHVFSKHLQFLGWDEMAETAAAIGFEGVDLSVRPGGHVLPENVSEDLPKAVAAIRRQGLQAAMMTTALTDAADETNRRLLQTASQLGISHYRTDWLWYDDKITISENLSLFRKKLEALGKLNQELKLVGDYQNHAGFGSHPLGSPVWDLAALLDQIANPFMGCQYDIRHATVEGGTSWPLGLKRIQPHIHSLVVKDFKWGRKAGRWQIINTPIGEGMVDFPKFFSLLKEYNIAAPVSVHFEYSMPEHQKNLFKKQIRQQTIELMQQDLNVLKGYRKAAGLEG